MRIPFLILCLVVVYGACHTDSAENIDVAKKIQHNEDYQVDYANIPFERFLARHKRTTALLKPVTFPIEMVLKMLGFNNGIIATSVDIIKLISGAFIGLDVCPKVEISLFKLIYTIPKILLYPLETIKTLICYFFQITGKVSRELMVKAFNVFVQFTKSIFLPGLHTALNALNNTGILPPQISAMIQIFNLTYKFLQMMGYL